MGGPRAATTIGPQASRAPKIDTGVSLKSMMPKTPMGGDISKWRDFKEDVEEWMNLARPGLRVVLQAASKAPDGVRLDRAFLESKRVDIEKCMGRVEDIEEFRLHMFGAVRTVLVEEARAVWNSTMSKDGRAGDCQGPFSGNQKCKNSHRA